MTSELKDVSASRYPLIEYHLDYRQRELFHLNQACQDRAVSSAQYLTAMESLEGQLCHIRQVLLILHQHSNMLRGEILDCHRQLEQLSDIDAAIDQLIDNLRTHTINPAGMTSYPEARLGADRGGMQEPFKNSPIKYVWVRTCVTYLRYRTEYYDTRWPNDPHMGPKEGHWCPISHCYCNRQNGRAAHIVPFAMVKFSCAYLFGRNDSDGDRPNHLFDVRNRLLIHKGLEEALDRVQIMTVPCESEDRTSTRNLKVVVINKSVLIVEKKLCP